MLPQKIDKVIPESFLPNEIVSKPGKNISELVYSRSYCSCSPCDQVTCFELRNRKSALSCTCSMCKNPNVCTIFNENVRDKQSDSKNINTIKKQNETEKIEKELCSEITKVANTELDNCDYSKFGYEEIFLKRNNIDSNVKNKVHDESTTRQYVDSVAIKYLPNARKNSTAELTAQIMNVPYQDLKDSLSMENSSSVEIISYPSIEELQKNSFNPPKPSFDFGDIMKPDFLTRLKEIYNACSCKVCECITGTSLVNNSNECNCKPCDCDECTNNVTNRKNYVKHTPHDGCPCVSCDRKDCRGVVKKKDEISCSCVPCDCVKCSENFPTSCDCEPCQCIECKALGASLLKNRTVIVAPIHENIQQNLCQCEPCDCVNCTHNYSSMASSLRHQVSTEIISNRNCRCDDCLNDPCQLNSEDCRCDMQSKVMKKPIERASRDYDIHSTLISCQKEKRKFNKRDTIVTFALYTNNCNTISYSNSKVHDCYCSTCECLVCKGKDDHKGDSKRIHSELLNKDSKPCFDSFNTCKCSLFDCQICSKSNKHANKIKEEHFKTSCKCNECNCFLCKRMLNTKNENIVHDKGLLVSETNNFSCEKYHFLRKGKILIPSMFEVDKDIALQRQSSTNISDYNLKRKPKQISYFNVPANDSSSAKISCHQIVTACHTGSKHRITDKIISESTHSSPNNFLLKEYFSTNDDSKYVVDKMHVVRKSTSFSEENANHSVDGKLCEIFNANKPCPIRNIELLDTFIHLTKSLSNTDVSLKEIIMNSDNVTKNKYDDDNEKGLFDIKASTPLTSHSFTVQTIPSAMVNLDKNIDEKDNIDRLHSVSSKTFVLCDKKSQSLVSNRKVLYDMNSISKTNNLESDFKIVDKIHTDYMLDEVNEIVGLRSHILENDLKVKDAGITVTTDKSNTKLVKRNSHKSTVKCVGKKYIKMYNKFNKKRQIKDRMKEDAKDIKALEARKSIVSFRRDICPLNNIEKFEYSVNERKDSVLQTTISSTVTPHSVFSTKNALHNIIETQTQNIDCSDNSEAWSIMRKNLYLNEPYVSRIKEVCTIPELDIEKKSPLKSKSMQTSALANSIERSSGKHALAKLLVEVNDLLNSSLLKSSHSNKKFGGLEEKLSHISKKSMALEFKTASSDATSQTRANYSPVDKETNCTLIQPKVFLPRNTKLVTDNVLTNAAYKSDQLSKQQNVIEGYTQNMPKINSCKSSCHGLKATFISLRTISDHTVMVKWRLPREVAYVKGYELQVDGRPVQKIFSPTRCMAILTCLPHSEKLLLTIRTLATTDVQSDHQPATTIVYRPRVKC